MKMNDVFPSKYLKADDLKDKNGQNKSFTLVISGCAMEVLGQGQNADNRLVIYFQNAQKGMVCNKTNAERISYLYGDDTDMWVGKQITLYSELVNFQGNVGPAIRVRPPEPRPTSPARTMTTQPMQQLTPGTFTPNVAADALALSDDIPF